MPALRLPLAFIAAVLATTVLGSIIQTQFNMSFITGMGVPVGTGARLSATLHDLVSFTPTFVMMVGVGFLIGFVVAALLIRVLARARDQMRAHVRTGLYALAGATAIFVAILSLNAFMDGIHLIPATRGALGMLALVLTGAIGGLIFSRIWRRPATTA